MDFEWLADALSEQGRVGNLDNASALITTDGEGYPFVCLLSSRQLAVRAHRVVALVGSRRTIANLERNGRATLHLIHDGASVLAKLELKSTRLLDAKMLVVFEVSMLDAERRSTVLTPIKYLLDAEILASEGSTIQEVIGTIEKIE